MATKKLDYSVGGGYLDDPDYKKLLDERKKAPVQDLPTARVRPTEVESAYDDLYADNTQTFNDLTKVAQFDSSQKAQTSIAQNKAYLARAGQHNANVADAVRQDKLEADLARANALAAKGQAKIGISANEAALNLSFSPGSSGVKNNYSLSGLGLNSEQQSIAKKIVQYGASHGFSEKDIRTALITGYQESRLRNLSYGDRDSGGVFQQRPSQGWGSYAQVRNVNYSIQKFYSALSKTSRAGDAWNVAQRVQRSFDQSNGGGTKTYKNWWGLSGQILSRALNPVGDSSANRPKSLQTFMNAHMGEYTDYDKAYGTQCVDLFRYYIKSLGQPQPGSVGGAKNIWTNSTMAANNTRISKSGKAKAGDIAVFGGSVGGGYGHVGIVLSDNGSTVKLFNSHSGNKKTDITIMSKSALLGYWRPNR